MEHVNYKVTGKIYKTLSVLNYIEQVSVSIVPTLSLNLIVKDTRGFRTQKRCRKRTLQILSEKQSY